MSTSLTSSLSNSLNRFQCLIVSDIELQYRQTEISGSCICGDHHEGYHHEGNIPLNVPNLLYYVHSVYGSCIATIRMICNNI